MKKSRRNHHGFLISGPVLACLIASASTQAQDAAKPAAEKWRPKNGVYALAGKGFAERCENSGDFSVELGEKNVAGDEWSCAIKKLTDIGPNAIRLDLTCSDENLEAVIPKPDPNSEELQFKETMTFRKIDDKLLFIRKSQNGKTDFPESRVAYCPPKAQRAYIASKKK